MLIPLFMIIILFIIPNVIATLCDCNSGICVNTTCYCSSPYVGEKCNFVIDYQYGMTHQHMFSDYVGHPKQIKENDCHSDCSQEGICVNSKCYCKSPYGGEYCQLKVDFIEDETSVKNIIKSQDDIVFHFQQELLSLQQIDKKQMYKKCQVPCRNNGYCVYGQCMCPSPYVGDYCQYTISFSYEIPHYQVVILCIFCYIVGAALVVVIFIILKIRDEAKKKYELISADNKDLWKKG